MSTMNVRADVLRDLREALEIDPQAVRGRAGEDQLRLMLVRETLDGVVVDRLVPVEAIADRLEPLAAHVDGHAVREVAAFGEAHARNVSPGFSSAKNTAWFACEPEFGCTFAAPAPNSAFARSIAERLDDVDVLAAAVSSACPGSPRRTCW